MQLQIAIGITIVAVTTGFTVIAFAYNRAVANLIMLALGAIIIVSFVLAGSWKEGLATAFLTTTLIWMVRPPKKSSQNDKELPIETGANCNEH